MSQLKRFLIVLVVLICNSISIFAQQAEDNKYVLRQINSREGLSDNNIKDFLMLPNGVMVLYSPTMLSLYDGISFVDIPFDSTLVPYKEFITTVEMSITPDNEVFIVDGDKAWCLDANCAGFKYVDNEFYGASLSDVRAMVVDAEGRCYIYTRDSNLCCYNPSSGDITQIQSPVTLTGEVRMKQYEHYIYILTKGGTLLRYDTILNTFTNVINNLSGYDSSDVSRYCIDVDSSGNIWVMYDYSLCKINARSFEEDCRISIPSGTSATYTSFVIDSLQNLWLGTTKHGILMVDIESGEIIEPNIEIIDHEYISNKVGISNIYADHKGGVWFSTESDGIFYYHDDVFRLKSAGNNIDNLRVKCMIPDGDNYTLLATPEGLYRYDSQRDMISVPYPELADADCISIYRDSKNRIWLGTFRRGLYCIDNGEIRHYFYEQFPSMEISYQQTTPNYNCARCICEDSFGNMWISVYGGLARFNEHSGEISLLSNDHPELSHFMFVRDIISVGNELYACGNDGCFIYNIADGELDVSLTASESYSKSSQLLEDSQGVVWVATSMGLRIIANGKERQILTKKDGLVSNNIIAVIEDNLSNIWAVSPSSISRVNLIFRKGEMYDVSITSFVEDDGLKAGLLYPKSIVIDAKGTLYIGGSRGLCSIVLSDMYQDSDSNPPIITNLHINNTLIRAGEEYNGRVILNKKMSLTENITLNYDESFISFDFSNLNYVNPNHTLYRYKLENFDTDWTQITSKQTPRATYTLLKPGNYIFKVIATNNGTDWSQEPATISVEVRPPFYKSTWAYLIYIALVVFIVIYTLYMVNRRSMERIKRIDQARKEELSQLKFRFFTNISHELRTPLSLILLPLESILRKLPADSVFVPQLRTIERNAQHLLSLVNHLLDFRKLEMGGERLTLAQNNPVTLVESIISDFSGLSNERNIALTMIELVGRKLYYFDALHINKVLNNLISNAIKFTPDGGSVTITISESNQGNLVIEVQDSGEGISEEDLNHIWDRFYQVKSNDTRTAGSGIGLHLVKQYVELHQGVVSVESKLGLGSTFHVELPNVSPERGEERCDENLEEDTQNEELRTQEEILIVEDNSDFREYLSTNLRELNYKIYTAVDGEDGIKKAMSIQPSLIISDIMMPKCDGFTLSKTLKNNINTSHIPIILLTARTADDVRCEGYKVGADAYISKPFSFEVLEIRIQKLIEERQRRMESVKSSDKLLSSLLTTSTLDEKLMTQVIDCIEKNMSNVEYSVEQLSRDVAMHRMSLYRKIQSIAGITPSEFIRTMRLKRAAELLTRDKHLSVAEVSEMVGFNTQKYFSTYFRKLYGVLPSQYASNARNSPQK